MRLGKKWRIGVFVGALAGSVGLVTAAAGATGAYFNDSQSGTVTGTIGSIKVTTAGGNGNDGLDFNFANMVPGDFQTSTVHYANTGLPKMSISSSIRPPRFTPSTILAPMARRRSGVTAAPSSRLPT